MKESQKKKDLFYFILFVIILTISIKIRIPMLFVERFWPDEALYSWYALQLFLDPSYLFSAQIIEYHPPLFAIIASLFHFSFTPLLACHVATFLFNLTGIIFIYLLGKRIQGQFLGIFSAVALSFNYVYLAASSQILLDAPMSAMFIIITFLMIRTLDKPSKLAFLSLGIFASFIILLKWSGIVVLLYGGLFFVFFTRQQSREEKLKCAVHLLLPPLLVTGLLLINNYVLMGKILPQISALQGFFFIHPPWGYIANFNTSMGNNFLCPLFLAGVLLSLSQKRKEELLIITWFLLFFISLSLMPEKAIRYSLMFVPPAILLSGLGVVFITEKWLSNIKHVVLPAVLILMCIFYLFKTPGEVSQIHLKSHRYSRYDQAGALVKKELSDQGTLIVSSHRAMRYHTGIDFKEFGGRLHIIPRDQSEFEYLVRTTESPVILELDIWEWYQPDWIYPLNEEKIDYLKNLGFKISSVIKFDEEHSIFWIFRLEYES